MRQIGWLVLLFSLGACGTAPQYALVDPLVCPKGVQGQVAGKVEMSQSGSPCGQEIARSALATAEPSQALVKFSTGKRPKAAVLLGP